MKHLVWILALAVAFAPGASAMGADNKYNLPQLGWAGESAISQTKLDEIGKQMLIELRRNRLLLRDPLITDYIRDVGRRIDSNSNSPGMHVHYYVINTPIINSFALPGGNVFIFTGMLLHTDNEN
jgi:predicted Zn-dependent protease